jgi:hypothetical protein
VYHWLAASGRSRWKCSAKCGWVRGHVIKRGMKEICVETRHDISVKSEFAATLLRKLKSSIISNLIWSDSRLINRSPHPIPLSPGKLKSSIISNLIWSDSRLINRLPHPIPLSPGRRSPLPLQPQSIRLINHIRSIKSAQLKSTNYLSILPNLSSVLSRPNSVRIKHRLNLFVLFFSYPCFFIFLTNCSFDSVLFCSASFLCLLCYHSVVHQKYNHHPGYA